MIVVVVVHIDLLQLPRFVGVENVLLAGMKDMQYTAKVLKMLAEYVMSDDEMYVKMHELIEMLEASAEKSEIYFTGESPLLSVYWDNDRMSDDFPGDGVIDDGFAVDAKDCYVPQNADDDSDWDEELGLDWDEIRDCRMN
jgi:hypothetical protein